MLGNNLSSFDKSLRTLGQMYLGDDLILMSEVEEKYKSDEEELTSTTCKFNYHNTSYKMYAHY